MRGKKCVYKVNKTANHVNYVFQSVDPDEAMKTKRFGCVAIDMN